MLVQDGQIKRANETKDKLQKLPPGALKRLGAFINFLVFLDKHPKLSRLIKRPGTWIFYHV